MEKLKVLDLFSGIGGFSIGLERTGGFETVAFCEIEEFPRKVLKKHWPEVPCYEDVTKLTGDILRRDGISVDVITGGFPCQDISTAGKQAGMSEGTRSGLWSEIVRLIGDLRPSYIIVENVANLLRGPSGQRGGWFGRILGDLAECGYDAEWENIPAGSVGAIHLRERVWLVAYPQKINVNSGDQDGGVFAFYREGAGRGEIRGSGLRKHERKNAVQIGGQPILCSLDERLSYTMVQHQIAAFGNTVYPKIPEMIGNAILAAEGETRWKSTQRNGGSRQRSS